MSLAMYELLAPQGHQVCSHLSMATTTTNTTNTITIAAMYGLTQFVLRAVRKPGIPSL